MSHRAQRGKTKFSELWKEAYPWVSAAKDVYSAECTLCRSSFCVASMGVQALKSHADGKKHKSLWDLSVKSESVATFLKKDESKTTETNQLDTNITSTRPNTEIQSEMNLSAAKKKKSTIDCFLTKNQVTMNEALWCIQTVLTHRSLRAAESDILLLKKMISDEVIQNMKMSRTKISYVINHGLGPYFNEQLLQKIQPADNFVVAFDESLNKFAQSQQMDVHIRFWEHEKNEIRTRYLTSVFLNSSKAVDLLQALKTALKELDIKKLIQISMDGPNVNWKVFTLLEEEMKSDIDNPRTLLNIGSCGIHVVHCAFKNGMKRTKWELTAFLRAIFYLFKDSPSRRGSFTRITGCKIFPLKFCETRWIENISVVKRALALVVHLKKYMTYIEENSQMQPKCKSYQTVKEAINDDLLSAKLAFFETLAGDVEPFMCEFQTDAPVTPLLYSSLRLMTETLMTRIVKKEVLNSTPLRKIDVSKQQDLLSMKEVDVGFKTRSELGKVKNISSKRVTTFYDDCRTAIQFTIKKIMERSPLKYNLTRLLSCLNPDLLFSNDANKLMRQTLDEFVNSNVITAEFAERVKQEYSLLIQSPNFKESVQEFRQDEMRLDNFWTKCTDANDRLSNLKRFVQLALLLSHGNASVERGFSINKECIVENQRNQSLIAQRQIFDSVTDIGGVTNVSFAKPIVHAVRNAFRKYQEALEEERKGEEEERKDREKQKEEQKALRLLEQRQREMDEDRDRLVKEIEKKKKIIGKKT